MFEQTKRKIEQARYVGRMARIWTGRVVVGSLVVGIAAGAVAECSDRSEQAAEVSVSTTHTPDAKHESPAGTRGTLRERSTLSADPRFTTFCGHLAADEVVTYMHVGHDGALAVTAVDGHFNAELRNKPGCDPAATLYTGAGTLK